MPRIPNNYNILKRIILWLTVSNALDRSKNTPRAYSLLSKANEILSQVFKSDMAVE